MAGAAALELPGPFDAAVEAASSLSGAFRFRLGLTTLLSGMGAVATGAAVARGGGRGGWTAGGGTLFPIEGVEMTPLYVRLVSARTRSALHVAEMQSRAACGDMPKMEALREHSIVSWLLFAVDAGERVGGNSQIDDVVRPPDA